MPSLDRTKEFLSIVEIERNQFSSPLEDLKPVKVKNKNSKEKEIPKSSFLRKVGEINDDLLKSQVNLKKLRELVKQRTPFDDNNASVQKYTVMIKQQLQQCNYEIRQLEEEQSEKRATQTAQQNRHFGQILSSLQSVLMFSNKQLMSVLKKRSRVLKTENRRRQKIITDHRHFDSMDDLLSPVKSTENLLLRQSPEEIEVLVENVNNQTGSPSPGPGSKSRKELIEENVEEQMRLQEQTQVSRQDNRTEEVVAIGKDIEQLTQMFSQMANMVVKQKELTQRIDDNVTDAHAHVEGGQRQLIKYHNKISSNRGLILKIFAVLVLFIIIIGLLVVK